MNQNDTISTLSDDQIRMAHILADPSEKGTIENKCQKAGVSRATFYRWMKDRQFVQYVNSLIDTYTDTQLAEVWRALINLAKKGDLAAIRMFFEMKGKYVEKKSIEANVNHSYEDQLKGLVDGGPDG